VWDWVRKIRGQTKVDPELKRAMVHAGVLGDSQRPISQQELLQQMGINLQIIEDEGLNSLLERMSFIENKDNDGNETVTVDLDTLALRVMSSKLIRTSFVDPIDAEIAQLEVDRFIDRVEMNMDEDTYEFGGTNLLEAFGKVIQTAWSDAKNGKKARLLKASGRVIEVGMPQSKKEGVMPR